MFAQVLGQLEEISHELIPRVLEGRRAAELFNDAARAERLCVSIKSRSSCAMATTSPPCHHRSERSRPKLRRAVEARYPTCGVEACANDQFLEIDHVIPLADNGCTELDNLWRLCSHHHRLKTYGGWTVNGTNGVRNLVPP